MEISDDIKAKLQAAFDKVWDWFVVQGKPRSFDQSAGASVYRGENGRRCAAGVLIPDEEYNESLEVGTVGEMSRLGVMPPSLLAIWNCGYDAQQFLRRIQLAHDHVAGKRRGGFSAGIRIDLTEVAAEFSLSVPSLTT